MSTVSGFLLIIASGLVRDVYQRFFRPGASEKEIARASYMRPRSSSAWSSGSFCPQAARRSCSSSSSSPARGWPPPSSCPRSSAPSGGRANACRRDRRDGRRRRRHAGVVLPSDRTSGCMKPPVDQGIGPPPKRIRGVLSPGPGAVRLGDRGLARRRDRGRQPDRRPRPTPRRVSLLFDAPAPRRPRPPRRSTSTTGTTRLNAFRRDRSHRPSRSRIAGVQMEPKLGEDRRQPGRAILEGLGRAADARGQAHRLPRVCPDGVLLRIQGRGPRVRPADPGPEHRRPTADRLRPGWGVHAIVRPPRKRDGDRLYNACVLVGPSRSLVGSYRKIHLPSPRRRQVRRSGRPPLRRA